MDILVYLADQKDLSSASINKCQQKTRFDLTLADNPDLQQSKSHPDAVPGSLTEGQESVRASFRLLLRAEVIRLKLFRVVEVLLVLHDHRAAK